MTIRICVAGATGWTGSALVPAIEAAADLQLAGAVARRAAGKTLAGVTVRASVAEALDAAATDVLVDYTGPDAVKANVFTALERGVGVVIGASGLAAADYEEIDAAAKRRGVGVIAAGNFSLTAALLQRLALIAAAHVPQWEIIDYASFEKPDVPSGTTRELAERLGAVRAPAIGVPVEKLHGPKEARGAEIAGVRIHSVRLPGYVISCEAVFGLAGERLSIRHDAGESAAPYVAGTLLAARRVRDVTGVVRGLDTLLFGPA
jgi:4-hydroxy-tetrahydrodipicolinate reductase